MINIVGTYECKADAKGRIMLPVALKKQLKKVIGEGLFNKLLNLAARKKRSSHDTRKNRKKRKNRTRRK